MPVVASASSLAGSGSDVGGSTTSAAPSATDSTLVRAVKFYFSHCNEKIG